MSANGSKQLKLVHQVLLLIPLQAYGKARLQGTDEIGSVLMSISSDLLAFDFKETFVNAFDVSNAPL